MNIEKSIEILKAFRNYNKFYKEENKDLAITITLEAKESIDKAIERLLTAYEKEKRLAEANLKDSEEFKDNMCNHRCILNSKVEELETELEEALNEKAEVRISASADNQIRQLQTELEKEKEIIKNAICFLKYYNKDFNKMSDNEIKQILYGFGKCADIKKEE